MHLLLLYSAALLGNTIESGQKHHDMISHSVPLFLSYPNNAKCQARKREMEMDASHWFDSTGKQTPDIPQARPMLYPLATVRCLLHELGSTSYNNQFLAKIVNFI